MSDDKVVTLFTEGYHDPGSQEAVVELLQELLESAQKGEIIGIIIGTVQANGYIGTRSAKGGCIMAQLVATSAALHFDLMYNWTIGDTNGYPDVSA
jgi:hypothetical protein